ncbi:hypothetical protein [Leifsonia sp. Leaf264]|uniref:hypothetical protein n=1 Tax=Leifsonia sp. Leaf264 TaxID=1736314 RepID=UPI0006F819DD|nr:hypothetical protein [Leifsonia sp. Leaf264]KQO98627.1 hypothetical protein ASF30_11230 [Leifsonia sp. Leaf264]
MLKLLPVVLLVLVTVGCAAAAPQPSKAYDTLEELRQDYMAADGECGLLTESKIGERPAFTMAYGDCNGGESRLALFEDTDQQDAFLKKMKDNDLGLGRHLLVGENWVIAPEDENPGKYQSELGGEAVNY